MKTLSLITACLCLIAPITEAATPNKGGQFNSAASRKAYPHIERAMTLPMAELAEKATELKPEYVLSYGLALELGRAPIELNSVQRGRVQGVFQDFLNSYVRKKDGIKLEGTEEALLGQPDFWIMMARAFGRKQNPQQAFIVGSTVDRTGVGPSAGFSITMNTLSDNSFTKEDYTLKGDAVLNRYMVFASQACAIYGKVSEQMKKALVIDASATTHLPPERLGELKATAKSVYKDAQRLGPQACGSREYFNRVSVYAAAHLGTLGTLKSDPDARVEEVAATLSDTSEVVN
ncbi:hypothetical protein [Asticcacaulis machinosus]|uniref:Uncharacterized protein n=1 Tax=Asticcacaulis machinosus TaxID=2984211 RepID=A0ABT5HLK5_9CAUL|nr:hypothetical protein [Asticcacaulis machinosus]MDC7676883.1 hypothetical protein [Asticcacaulis machinosus]